MERQSVDSSNLRAVGYDRDVAVLEIQFQTGSVYQYLGLPESVYRALMAASSKGSFFNANIKGCFPYRQVG
jgi:hypothetical protein